MVHKPRLDVLYSHQPEDDQIGEGNAKPTVAHVPRFCSTFSVDDTIIGEDRHM